MPEAVIVDALRTPITIVGDTPAAIGPEELGASTIDELLSRNPEVAADAVDWVVCGWGMPEGREAFRFADLVVERCQTVATGTYGVSITRFCAASMLALRQAMHEVYLGDGSVYVAAGFECASRFLYGSPDEPRAKPREVPSDFGFLGSSAALLAAERGISREDMDEYARTSHARARAAWEDGRFDGELASIDPRGEQATHRDDGPLDAGDLDRLGELPGAFGDGDLITTGNSARPADGAAALLVMSDVRAHELGLAPIARIITSVTEISKPVGLGGAGAVERALERSGMTVADVDAFELSEPFAAHVLAIAEHCEIPLSKINTWGGAIALGHPFGATGARLMTTLLNRLRTNDQAVGLVGMNATGGLGEAMVVERIA